MALLSADGALEAAPAMGCADIILDLVSTGVTLRENNLRQIEGGKIVDSQGVLVRGGTVGDDCAPDACSRALHDAPA